MSLLFDKCFLPGDAANDQPVHYQEPQPPPDTADPSAPYLVVDLYPFDLDDPRTPQLEDPPWATAFDANPHLVGGFVKLHDGGGYAPRFTDWGVRQLGKILSLKKFGGGYLFSNVATDPIRANAEPYARALERAGWVDDENGIVACIDLEESPQNSAASAHDIIKHTTAIAEWLVARFGREVMLYGRGIMRDACISSRMGCSRYWNPSYTRYIDLHGAIGPLPNGNMAAWDWDTMKLWQAIGDGKGDNSASHLPKSLEGFGGVDISAVIDGAKPVTWERVRAALL